MTICVNEWQAITDHIVLLGMSFAIFNKHDERRFALFLMMWVFVPLQLPSSSLSINWKSLHPNFVYSKPPFYWIVCKALTTLTIQIDMSMFWNLRVKPSVSQYKYYLIYVCQNKCTRRPLNQLHLHRRGDLHWARMSLSWGSCRSHIRKPVKICTMTPNHHKKYNKRVIPHVHILGGNFFLSLCHIFLNRWIFRP